MLCVYFCKSFEEVVGGGVMCLTALDYLVSTEAAEELLDTVTVTYGNSSVLFYLLYGCLILLAFKLGVLE